jgi:hypothetical protein
MLVLSLLLASVAISQTAEARPRGLPGTLFGFFTNPVGTILNAGHAGRRTSHRRRAKAPRSKPAATAQSKPEATGTRATAATPAATGIAAAAVGASAVAAGENAVPITPSATNAADSAGASVVHASAPAESIPIPAPAQRAAALTAEPRQARSDEAPLVSGSGEPKLGIVGPSSWPSAYEDVIGFTFWPKEYSAQLRDHGIGDVLAAIVTPAATPPSGTRSNTTQANAGGPAISTAAASDPCGGATPDSDWPAADIARTMQLNAAQGAALNRLKITLGDGVTAIRSACREQAALSPTERLRATQNMLSAVHDATVQLRTPLAKFYNALTENQKKQFAAPASASADPRTISRDDVARMCGVPASNELQIRQIEQVLQPTKAQRTSLDALQKKSFEMGQFLMASCLRPIAVTPTERLDAAADRLTAVIFAASTVGLALNDLYNQLSDQQKAKLNGSGS